LIVLRAARAFFAGVALLVAASAGAGPIRTNADLDRYLERVAPGESPLDRLSAQARGRFLADFRGGVFPTIDDLEAELTRDEAAAILNLFDAGAAASLLTPRIKHLAIGATETPEVGARFAALRSASRGSEARDATRSQYGVSFAPRQSEAALRTMSDGDVALYLRAALAVTELDPDARSPHDALLDLSELERRGVAAPTWIRRVHAALVRSRDFAAANAFRERHPDAKLTEIPPVREEPGGDGPSVLALDDNGGVLIHRRVAFDPAQVVVVAGCHFSKDAAHAIESDPRLAAAFSRHVLWITPAEWNPADADLVQWNREHPIAFMSTVYRESEWPMIDTWAMPTFYFLHDGKVRSKVIGWQPDAILSGFREIGLGP
jgi:hypothetical protein